jgi:hypothetical protein
MSKFEELFLEHYLRLGLGSMPKADVDALVMHLLDFCGLPDGDPLADKSNQSLSELLKAPVSKIKKLRYDAALKYGGQVDDQAKGRMLAALSRASYELADDTIRLIIEDNLAKNWLQGQLKNSRQIFDHSFNAEMIAVSAIGFFDVLEKVFEKTETEVFRRGYLSAKKKKTAASRKKAFKKAALSFAHEAASASGMGVVSVLKLQMGVL